MQFRSSFNIFKPKSHSFIYHFFKQSFDFQRISKQLYLEFYSSKKSKNNSYDLSSMLRLFLILNLFSKSHSYNKYLNGKLGIKIHTLSIVYPFILPISFDFTPANHHDSPILRKLISTIAPIFADLNTPIYLTADKDYYGYENIEALHA